MGILPLWAALLVALLAGILYATLLCTVWGRKLTTHKTHVATVLGVALTLGCVALVDIDAAWLGLLFFVATGVSQIVRREVMDMIERDRIIKIASGNDKA